MSGLGDYIALARMLTDLGAAFVTAGEPRKSIAPLTTAMDTMQHGTPAMTPTRRHLPVPG